jgi:hypothetical protein
MTDTMRDTSVHGPSGEPLRDGDLSIPGIVLDPSVVAAFATAQPIRLNNLLHQSHDIRHPNGTWYRFVEGVMIVETEDEAEWVESEFERIYGAGHIKRDDLPQPIACELCHAKGRVFTTRCLPFYARHMFVAHAG